MASKAQNLVWLLQSQHLLYAHANGERILSMHGITLEHELWPSSQCFLSPRHYAMAWTARPARFMQMEACEACWRKGLNELALRAASGLRIITTDISFGIQ